MRISGLLVALCMVCVGSGCQQYPVRPMPGIRATEAPARASLGSTRFGSKAFTDSGEIKAIFNADLMSKGVLPVLLIVDNDGGQEIELMRQRFQLTTSNGTRIEPINPDAATTDQGRNAMAEAFFFFGMFSYDDANKYNTEMRRDWVDKGFSEVQIIRPGGAISKFLYFKVGKDFAPAGSVLLVPVQPGSGGPRQTVSLKF